MNTQLHIDIKLWIKGKYMENTWIVSVIDYIHIFISLPSPTSMLGFDWNFTFSFSSVFTKQIWPQKLFWLGISWLGNSRTLFLFFRASLTVFTIPLMRSCQTIIVKKTMLAIFQKLYYIPLKNWAGINQCKHENYSKMLFISIYFECLIKTVMSML